MKSSLYLLMGLLGCAPTPTPKLPDATSSAAQEATTAPSTLAPSKRPTLLVETRKDPAGNIKKWEWLHPQPIGQDLHAALITRSGELVAVGAYGAILRSKDKGQSWALEPSDTTEDLAFLFETEDALFALSRSGNPLRKRGEGPWEKITFEGARLVGNLEHVFVTQSRLYLQSGWGDLFFSSDAGLSWQHDKATQPMLDLKEISNTLWLGVTSKKEILRSTDQGKTWTASKTEVAKLLEEVSAYDQLGYITTQNNLLFVLSRNGTILQSKDQGATWSLYKKGKPGCHVVAAHLDPDGAWIGYGLGIWRASAEGDWERLEVSGVDSLAGASRSASGETLLVGKAGSIVYAPNPREPLLSLTTRVSQMPGISIGPLWGASAEDVFAASTFALLRVKDNTVEVALSGLWSSVWGADAAHIFAGGGFGQFVSSNDGGQTWQEQTIKHDGYGLDIYDVFGLSADELFVLSNEVFGRSLDGGKTWKTQSMNHKLVGLWGNKAQGLYAVGEKGLLLRSMDLGVTWEEVFSIKDNELAAIWGSERGDIFVVGSKGLVLSSNNQGKTWAQTTVNPTTSLTDIYGFSTGELFITNTSGSLLRSTDRGKTWEVHSEFANVEGLNFVWGATPDQLWVSGSWGRLLRGVR